MKKQIQIIVFGQVQGVLFRQGVKINADKLGIYGFVKNQEDGSVKIAAEGEEEKLQKLIKWCRKGTEFSEVKDIKIKLFESNEKFTTEGGSVSGGKNFQIL